MKKNKIIQIRVTEEDYNTIKRTLSAKNISDMVRVFLLEKAMEELQRNTAKKEEIEEKNDLLKFKNFITDDCIIEYLYQKFKEV